MSVQLDIPGIAPPAPRLTDRQQLALAHIREHQPDTSEHLGAVLHADRRDRGGRGHDAATTCRYCHDEGSQMGRALRRHHLVVQKRDLGWCTPDYKHTPERPGASGYDPETSEIPF